MGPKGSIRILKTCSQKESGCIFHLVPVVRTSHICLSLQINHELEGEKEGSSSLLTWHGVAALPSTSLSGSLALVLAYLGTTPQEA